MKYARLLAITLTVIQILSTDGCHVTLPEDSVAHMTDAMTIANTSGTGYITSDESFTKVIGSIADLSLYEDPSHRNYHHADCTYYLKEENHIFSIDDYNITLTNGTEFTLNHPFTELEAQGWTLSDPERKIDPDAMAWITCKNASNYELYIGIHNQTANTLTARECTVFQAEFRMFSESDRFKPVSTTPGFTICETISHTSGLEAIINRLGPPTIIHYSSETDPADAEIELFYSHHSNEYDWLEFNLSADGDYILNMAFSYIPHE